MFRRHIDLSQIFFCYTKYHKAGIRMLFRNETFLADRLKNFKMTSIMYCFLTPTFFGIRFDLSTLSRSNHLIGRPSNYRRPSNSHLVRSLKRIFVTFRNDHNYKVAMMRKQLVRRRGKQFAIDFLDHGCGMDISLSKEVTQTFLSTPLRILSLQFDNLQQLEYSCDVHLL